MGVVEREPGLDGPDHEVDDSAIKLRHHRGQRQQDDDQPATRGSGPWLRRRDVSQLKRLRSRHPLSGTWTQRAWLSLAGMCRDSGRPTSNSSAGVSSTRGQGATRNRPARCAAASGCDCSQVRAATGQGRRQLRGDGRRQRGIGPRQAQFRKRDDGQVFGQALLAQQVAKAVFHCAPVLARFLHARDAGGEPGRMQQAQAFDGLAEVPEAAPGIVARFVRVVDADPEASAHAGQRAGWPVGALARMKGAVPLVSTSVGRSRRACSRMECMSLNRISGSPPVNANRPTPSVAAISSCGAMSASVSGSRRMSPGRDPS